MQFFGVQAKTYLFSKRQINEDEMENDEILRYEIIFPAAGANNGAVLLTRTSLVLSPKEGRKKYINIYIYIYIDIIKIILKHCTYLQKEKQFEGR